VRGMQLPQYFLQHSIGLLQCFIIPETDYPKPLRLKKSSSFCIACSLLCMLSAIQLHYQPLFDTDEINNIRRNRMLPPKLESAEAAIF